MQSWILRECGIVQEALGNWRGFRVHGGGEVVVGRGEEASEEGGALALRLLNLNVVAVHVERDKAITSTSMHNNSLSYLISAPIYIHTDSIISSSSERRSEAEQLVFLPRLLLTIAAAIPGALAPRASQRRVFSTFRIATTIQLRK